MCFLKATKRVLGYTTRSQSVALFPPLKRCKFREWETSQGNKSAISIWENGGRLLNWFFWGPAIWWWQGGLITRGPRPEFTSLFFPAWETRVSGNCTHFDVGSVGGTNKRWRQTCLLFIGQKGGPGPTSVEHNCWSVVIVPYVSSKEFIFKAARLKNAIEKNGFGKKWSPLELIMGFQAPHSSGEIGFNCRVGLGGNFWASFDTSVDRRENARRRSYTVFGRSEA